jgi:hypothetical protein
MELMANVEPMLDAVGRPDAWGDVERSVALLIAELKQIAQRHGVGVSVVFHCLVNERERYFSTSILDAVAEKRRAFS